MEEKTLNDTTNTTDSIPEDFSMKDAVALQRKYFKTGETKTIDFRIKQLRRLKLALLRNQDNLIMALKQDLNKSETESYATEIGITLSEIDYNIKQVEHWAKPLKVTTPLFFLPGKSHIHYEPYGVALIISPWNYPVKNLLGPMLGAMAAGNCMILKPSELAPNTSRVIYEMISSEFNPEYVKVIEGGVPETTTLLKERFDYILFTGGTEIGRIVYQAAAKHLTPVALELGGKSPTIVDEHIDLTVTARRILWGKFTNAGQTCIAPDYLLVNNKVKQPLINKMKEVLIEFYGDDPSQSPDLGRIVTDNHFQRIKKLIEGDVVVGGGSNEGQRYIAPTIIDNVKMGDKVMSEEIFGPVLPVIGYDEIDGAIDIVNAGEKPLALYIFSNNPRVRKKILNNTTSGGVCINETLMHIGNPNLPFGGVGNSGIGAYNGKTGFDTFSHKRSVMTRSFLFDVKQKYAPFTPSKTSFIKFALKRLF